MTHPAPSGAEAGRIATCRICHGERLTPVLDLGEQASADNFPPADDPGPDARWPLALVICDDCSLVQLANRSPDEEEPRAVESATSRTHASAVASRVATAAALSDAADILECSSAHGGSWAEALRALGHQVTTDALDGVQTYDLVIDNHSMIHDEDTDGAFATRAAHVAADGTFAIEFHHALPFLTRTQFDTIRHGHPVYLSLHAWSALCARHGFVVVDAWSEDVYGGCLVVLARRVGLRSPVELDVPNALRRLAAGAPESSIYAFRRGGRTFLGATPERLVRTEGRVFRTVAVAGTIRRGADADEDARLGRALLASEKDREEHAIVVSSIRALLAPVADTLTIAPEPGVMTLRFVRALGSQGTVTMSTDQETL